MGFGGLLARGEVERGEFFGVGGLVVGGVVGEYGGAVEGAVVFREVEPAFVADAFGALAADTDADNVGGGVEQVLAEGDEGLVAHFLNQRVDRHGVDEFFVADCFAAFESYEFVVCVHFGYCGMRAKHGLLFRNSFSHGDPDGACSAVSRESEGGIRAPVAGCLL